MPRISRAVAVEHPHHITQRGNYYQSVFDGDDDYIQYLQWLEKYCKKYFLKIWAYCLMSNHVHFIGVPMREESLAKTFNTLHMRYSQYFNRKRGLKGHLWQGRFYSCILDERHLYAALRYVENNPCRAGIVERPWEYKWSSARTHVYRGENQLLSDDCHVTKEIDDWRKYLEVRDEGTVVTTIRQNTKTGRPCGGESFTKMMEETLGRKLKVLPRGRPFNNK